MTREIVDNTKITGTLNATGAVDLDSTVNVDGVLTTTGGLVLKQSAAPAPTAEGDIQWDTDDNQIKVGDGAATKTFSDDSKQVLRAGGVASQMTGALLLASGGIQMMNAGGATITAASRAEVILTGVNVNGMMVLGVSSVTISGGAITVTTTYNVVDTQAAAATDDLDTINGGVEGAIVVLRTLASARDVTVKDGTGNISCPSDRVLSNVDDIWIGIFNGARWCEISYGDNA